MRTFQTALGLSTGLVVLMSGCANKELDVASYASSSDAIVFQAGEKAFAKKQWEIARQHFRRVVDAFPNSEKAPDARLGLGDAFFREGGTANYILATSEYRTFLGLYPSHPRSDYAQFQVGESFYKQRNGPDRDQTPTQSALEEFEKLLNIYPKSEHGETAKARIKDCRATLARAEHIVGYFYQRTRKAYYSAVLRYKTILDKYPDYPQTDEVLFRMAECLTLGGRPAEAAPYLDRLLKDHPDSRFSADGRALLASLPGPQPSPAPTTPVAPVEGAPKPEAQVSLDRMTKNS